MCSGCARVRSNTTCHGSTHSGLLVIITAPTCGVASRRKDFRGSMRVVTEWATRRRRAEKPDAQSLQRVPSARTIARLMTNGRDTLSKSETVTIAAIEQGVPLLVEAREVVTAFHAMIRKKAHADLDPWLERASRKPRRLFRQRRHQGQGRRQRSDHDVLVQRTDRRPDHQAQARQTSNVRTRQARPASGSPNRRHMTAAAPKLRQSPFCTPNDSKARLHFSMNQ